MKNKTFDVTYMGKERNVTLENIPEDVHNKSFLHIGDLNNKNHCVGEIQTDLHMLQSCPRIQISNTLFETIIQNDTSISDFLVGELLAIPNDDNETVFICIREYFRLAALVNCSQDFSLFDIVVCVLSLQVVYSLL